VLPRKGGSDIGTRQIKNEKKGRENNRTGRNGQRSKTLLPVNEKNSRKNATKTQRKKELDLAWGASKNYYAWLLVVRASTTGGGEENVRLR